MICILVRNNVVLLKDNLNKLYVLPYFAKENLQNEYFKKTLAKLAKKLSLSDNAVIKYLNNNWSLGTLIKGHYYIELDNTCESYEFMFSGQDLEDLDEDELEELGLCKCVDCGDIVQLDESTWVDDNGYVCENCLDENYVYTRDTERYIPRDDAYIAIENYEDDEYFYEYDDDLYYSNTMDCLIISGYECTVYLDSDTCDSDYVTKRYRNTHCYYCESNECWYTDYEDCIDNERDSNSMPDDWLADYSTHRVNYVSLENGQPTIFSNRYLDDRVKLKGFCGVGFELETEPTSNSNEYDTFEKIRYNVGKEYFMLKRDGSLCDNGVEIVSNPATFEAFESMKYKWNDMLEILRNNGYTSHENGRCGLHFHISRTLFGEDEETQNDNIMKLIKFYNENYDEIVKFSRREHGSASRWASEYEEFRLQEDFKEKFERTNKEGHGGDRYYAVNITNEYTVEIRIMRGTLKESTFWATYDFIKRVAMNSLNMNWDDVINNDLTKWLSGLEENTIEYAKTRNAFNSVFSN